MSELEVKWHCFAGRVALQIAQKARGGSLEAAWNLSPTFQLRAYGSCQLQKTTFGPRNLFSYYWGVHWGGGGEKLLQNENKCHSNWSVNCSPSSLELCSAFQPKIFNPKLKLSRFKQGIIKWKMSTVAGGQYTTPVSYSSWNYNLPKTFS